MSASQDLYKQKIALGVAAEQAYQTMLATLPVGWQVMTQQEFEEHKVREWLEEAGKRVG